MPIKKYDLVVTENFIPTLLNKEENINKLKECTTEDETNFVINCKNE